MHWTIHIAVIHKITISMMCQIKLYWYEWRIEGEWRMTVNGPSVCLNCWCSCWSKLFFIFICPPCNSSLWIYDEGLPNPVYSLGNFEMFCFTTFYISFVGTIYCLLFYDITCLYRTRANISQHWGAY